MGVQARGRGVQGGRGYFIYLAIYCTATWCFALKGLRTIRIQHGKADECREHNCRGGHNAQSAKCTTLAHTRHAILQIRSRLEDPGHAILHPPLSPANHPLINTICDKRIFLG